MTHLRACERLKDVLLVLFCEFGHPRQALLELYVSSATVTEVEPFSSNDLVLRDRVPGRRIGPRIVLGQD